MSLLLDSFDWTPRFQAEHQLKRSLFSKPIFESHVLSSAKLMDDCMDPADASRTAPVLLKTTPFMTIWLTSLEVAHDRFQSVDVSKR
jgi:hypothetical protein